MSPTKFKATGTLSEDDPQPVVYSYTEKEDKADYKMKIIWLNVLFHAYIHISAIYGLYLLLTNQVKFATVIYGW